MGTRNAAITKKQYVMLGQSIAPNTNGNLKSVESYANNSGMVPKLVSNNEKQIHRPQNFWQGNFDTVEAYPE